MARPAIDVNEGTPLLADSSGQMTANVDPPDAEWRSPSRQQEQHLVSNNYSCISKFIHCIKMMLLNVTLEPMLFMKMVAESNLVVVADTLEIERVCQVNLNYSMEDCQNMDDGNHTDLQAEVQKYQNWFNYTQNLMDSILPLLVVIFIGSLSDKYGRKPPMLAVLAGFVSFAVVYIMAALNPSWPVEVLYAATLSVDIMGTWVVFNMSVYSYMADITSPETRTKRMGLLDVVWYLGGPLGRIMGGWLYHWSGYVAVFSVSAILWFLCFLYVLILVHESVDKTGYTSNAEEEKYAHWGPFQHIIALFRTALKKRPGNARSLLFWLLSLKLMVFLTQGHQMYLWARRVLQWGATEFSTWTSIDSTIHMVGTVIWLMIATKFRIHETVIAIGGLISQGMWCAVLACISGPSLWWLVIVASVLGMLEETIEPAIRTMLTVVVGENEAGKVLALNGLLESAWLTVDRTIYTNLYNTFVKIFPQINLVVQSGVCIVLVLLLLYLRKVFSRQPTPSPILKAVHNLAHECNEVQSTETGQVYVN